MRREAPKLCPTSNERGGAAIFLRAELASLVEVRRLAETVKEATNRLDILINNAGIGTAGGIRQESADGFELRFAVNYWLDSYRQVATAASSGQRSDTCCQCVLGRPAGDRFR